MWATSNREQIFRQKVDSVFRMFYGILGNREDAEELTAATLVESRWHRDDALAVEAMDGEIAGTGRTVLAVHRRQFYAGIALPAGDDGDSEDFGCSADLGRPGARAAQVAERILEGLPDADRRILELRFLRDAPLADTARDLGITPQEVPALQWRALARAVQLLDGC